MCVLCGCPSCTGQDALERVDREFNLSVVNTTQGGTANFKWGNDIRGAASGEITWSLNLAGLSAIAGASIAEFEQAVLDAFNTWAAIAGVDFRQIPQVGGQPVDADIDIVMGPLAGSTIGLATTFFNPWDGDLNGLVEIISSDITMDTDVDWIPDGTSGGFTFFQVVLHEIGHALGFDHFNESDSVMHQTANSGSRSLGNDDIAGARNLYGEKVWTNASETAFFTKVSIGQTAYFKGGNDDVDGTAQADRFFGGAGNDNIKGAGGDDFIVDTRGNNDLVGGAGNDTILGGDGRIDAWGNTGNDTLVGGIGNDMLDGGSGNDTLRGDPSGSFISGNDTLVAGSGDDWLEGGGGADVFVFSRESGDNRIGTLDLSGARQIVGRDFEVGVDRIDLDAFNLNFNDVQNGLRTVDGNAVFTFNNGSTRFTLTIEDVLHTELTSGDFIL